MLKQYIRECKSKKLPRAEICFGYEADTKDFFFKKVGLIFEEFRAAVADLIGSFARLLILTNPISVRRTTKNI